MLNDIKIISVFQRLDGKLAFTNLSFQIQRVMELQAVKNIFKNRTFSPRAVQVQAPHKPHQT